MPEALLAVEEALRRILDLGTFVPQTDYVDIWQAQGRVLSADLPAKRTQPPFDASAMDGYAVRHANMAAPLQVVGESAAGHGFDGTVGPNQAVRIFTGAPIPRGADTVVLQEHVSRNGAEIKVLHNEPLGRHIRTAGLDFNKGQILLTKGTRLGVRELALAAAMNHDRLPVAHKPRVGILATGDELAFPGEAANDETIICSNSYSTAALVRQAGGEPVNLGIARDNFAALEAGIRRAQAAQVDILVTLGGASVGDHDLVQKALAKEGMKLAFWKVAMRPGKPLMHGSLGKCRFWACPVIRSRRLFAGCFICNR